MEQTIKRMVSFILAVIMLVSVSLFLAAMVSAASVNLTGVSGLDVTYTATTNCTVTNGNNSLTIKAKTSPETSSGCSTTPETVRTQNVTLKNNKTSSAILTFSYAVTLSDGSVSIDGTAITADGSFTKELAAGGTVVLSVTSGSTKNDSVLEVSEIFLVSNVSATVTFKTAQNGTYTVNDTAITEETQMTNHASVPYRLAATPASGYRLMDWYNETTGLAISVETAVEAYFDTSCTVYPRFISADAPVFMVGTVKYADLNAANTAATNSSTNKTIILVDGGTLPAGDYTISSGVTLLVPFNDANLAITNSNIKSNYEKYKESTPSVEYRRLTLASGANITVNGCVNVSSRVYCMSNGQSGPYGLIQMESGSSMSFGSGATLQCFGYIMGTGNVVLNPGAKAYGSIFCADYPGSTSNVTKLKNAKAFPFSKYSVKNVQAPLTIYHGAEMQLYLNLYGTSAGYHDAWVKFVGDTSSYLFSTANTGDYVTVSFQNERQIVRVHGTASINTLSLTVYGISASTKDMSGLPIPYNFDICIDSGSTVTVNENLICSKGSTITVEKEATVVIPQGKSVYVMDGSDDIQAVGTQPDAKLDVNGTIEVYGKLMTTSNKANVISSEGTGEIIMKTDIAENESVAVSLKQSGSAAQSVTAYPASLKNSDGTYTETKGAKAGTTFHRIESEGEGDAWGHTHEYDEHPAKEPTCTEPGWYAYRSCKYCDDTTYVEIPATGHTSVTDAAVNPTCTAPGLTVGSHCSVCDAVLKEQEIVAALGHDFGESTVTKEATCTETGIKSAPCSRCEATNDTVIPMLEHDYVNHEAKAPTCTEIGWDAYQTCSSCDYSTKVEIPALGHDYVNHEAKAATCTEIGWDAYQTCSRCDYTTYAEIPALDHDYVSHEAKAATCTEIGWDAYKTCSRCDYTTYAEIPALGHDYVNHEAKAATCTAVGWNAYQTCSRCEYTTYAELPALGHDYIDHEAQAATCTAVGWDAYQTCSSCDYTTYAEIPALGHDYVSHEAKAATCTEIGWDAYQTCSRCTYSTYVEKKALGHKYEDGVCEFCGKAELKIKSAYLKLNQNINILFNAEVDENMQNPYMVVTLNGVEYPRLQSSGKDARGYLVFEFTNISPNMMGDTICATLYATDSNGKPVCTSLCNYSIRKYCQNLQLSYPNDKPLQKLLNDVLVYGAAAQKYTNYKTDALVTEQKVENFVPPESSVRNFVGTENKQYCWHCAKLTLDNAVTVCLTLSAAPDATVEVSVNGRKQVFRYEDIVTDDPNVCVVNFRNLSPVEFGDTITAVIKVDGKQVGQTLEYSVNSYVYNMYKDEANPDLAELLKALYNYGESVKSYFK